MKLHVGTPALIAGFSLCYLDTQISCNLAVSVSQAQPKHATYSSSVKTRRARNKGCVCLLSPTQRATRAYHPSSLFSQQSFLTKLDCMRDLFLSNKLAVSTHISGTKYYRGAFFLAHYKLIGWLCWAGAADDKVAAGNWQLGADEIISETHRAACSAAEKVNH